MVTVGQTLYLRPTGNAARRSKEIKEVKVTKVGRKWLEVDPSYYGRFGIEDLKQDAGKYISDYQGYLSLEAIAEEDAHNALCSKIWEVFNRSRSLTREQAVEIARVLGISSSKS